MSEQKDKCPYCKGEGKIDALSNDGFGYSIDIIARCPDCKGTGELDRPNVQKGQDRLKVLVNGEWHEASDEFKETVRIIDEGLKRRDRPDRTKIQDILHPGKPCFADYPCPVPSWGACRNCNEQIDQLIALFPDNNTSCVGLENCCDLEAKLKEAKREERKDIGEWLLDEYDRTPLGKRIGLLEIVISKLVDGQALKETNGKV